MKTVYLTLSFVFTIHMAKAILNTDNSSYTPQQLVNNFLVGSGVTVSNITYAGAFESIGYFSNGAAIGMTNGILLTTGSTDVAIGPNTAADASYITGTPSDGDLENAAGLPTNSTHDACVLEFDMVSSGSEVDLLYVFASEEYPEFVCSAFNDAFAFLVTGPGYTPNTNVALIPTTPTPVAINSVNNGTPGQFSVTGGCAASGLTHSAYYVDNTGGADIQYDGYTVPLTAKIGVVPGASYHVKLVIADMSDEVLDSGIFLQANSLTSPDHTVSVSICPGDSVFAGGAWQSASGFYIDTLTAANGTDSVVVTHLSVINTFTNVSVSICQGDSFYFGNGWQHTSGTYINTFVSSLGCDSIVTVNLSVVSSIVSNISIFICAGDSAFAGGAWQQSSGVFYDYLIASAGCDSLVITTLTVDSALVWPGDANHDFVANNADLLPIGLYFGERGFPRDSFSYIWQGECAQNWGTIQANGSDRKHADCNGDGLIGTTDTLAIIIHYNLTHPKAEGSPIPAVGPIFTLVPHANVYHPGDTVTLDVVLGNNTNPVSELYGIAFDISFDNSLAEPGTVKLYYTDSWLGSVANNLTLSKLFESSGKADGALTRINHQDASGYGAIGVLQFVAKQSISSLQTATMSFSNYEAVKANGDEVLFDAQDATFTIDGTNSINTISNELSSLRIYPNPFTSSTTIEYSLKQDSEVSLKIYDVIGRVVSDNHWSHQSKGIHQFQFENQTPGKGLFIAELNVDGIKIRKRLVEME